MGHKPTGVKQLWSTSNALKVFSINLQIKHLITFKNTSFHKQGICWSQCRHATNIYYNSFLHTNNWLQMTTSSTTPSRYTILNMRIEQTLIHHFQSTRIQKISQF